MSDGMKMQIEWQGRKYSADIARPIHLAIPLSADIDKQPNAYGAPPYQHTPVTDGDFVGAIEHGSPVNFYNVQINPHGNGTHTECVGHIMEGAASIHESLNDVFLIAELVSIFPENLPNGDSVITPGALEDMTWYETEALIVRTLPNDDNKQYRKYTGTNPPFFSEKAMDWITARGYRHLLTDLPSVDKEHDDGALTAHRAFWQTMTDVRQWQTITEMIYANNIVEDGLYLLNIQIAAHDLDASPSRPVLFKLKANK